MKLGALLLLAAAPSVALAEAVTSAPHAAIAAGKQLFIDSHPDDPLLDALVDIGTLKRAGDAYEVVLRWPVTSGYIIDARLRHPELVVPPDGHVDSRERISCGPRTMSYFEIENTLATRDGKVVRREVKDAAQARREAEAQDAKLAATLGESPAYFPNPRSLVCWAIARKCKHEVFGWPPPRGSKPADYVPSCKLR